jgi:methylenetetrahydrofolate reductase (NADPH)
VRVPVPERWAEPVPAGPLRSVPLILTDFTSEPYSPASHKSVAAVLAPVSDAVLVGDHQRHPDFPPALLASLLQDVGARPWVTLTCRDRNRVALEQELAALRHLDVDAVLCVTGDGRPRTRPGAAPVFDLDEPRLTAPAAAAGIPAVVPETPAAPPRHLRPFRLGQKQRAAVRRVLASPDPVAAGIAFAAGEARTLLRIPGVAGVNISGLASARGYEFAARVKADLAQRVRDEFGEGHDDAR